MLPHHVHHELSRIAERLDRSNRPNISAVAADLLRLASSLEATVQPEMLGVIGDVDYVAHGGAVVHTDGTVDLIDPPDDEDDPEARWTIYRFMADQVDPATEWFGKDGLDGVAHTIGADPAELAARFQSDDVMERASAYLDVIATHGGGSFDTDPLQLTKEEVEARYPD